MLRHCNLRRSRYPACTRTLYCMGTRIEDSQCAGQNTGARRKGSYLQVSNSGVSERPRKGLLTVSSLCATHAQPIFFGLRSTGPRADLASNSRSAIPAHAPILCRQELMITHRDEAILSVETRHRPESRLTASRYSREAVRPTGSTRPTHLGRSERAQWD